MTDRPIFRPMSYLRAVCRITASLTGNTVPTRSRAILNFGHSVIVSDFGASRIASALWGQSINTRNSRRGKYFGQNYVNSRRFFRDFWREFRGGDLTC
jgi:hypothetical protein